MHRYSLTRCLFAASILALAAPIAAQDTPDGDNSIIVTGRLDRTVDGSEVRAQARAITPRSQAFGDPLARFQQPICAGVWGLNPESAQLIIDRIYSNAEEIGVDLEEEPGCPPNVLVLFVADPRDELDQLREARHYLVSGLSFWESKRLSEQEGPVRAWNVVTTRTRDGQARMGRPPVFDSTEISRLNSGTRTDLELSVVMIDSGAIAQLDGVAVADYVTMRTLARTSPPHADAAYGTILALFDNPAQAPERITSFDLAYLRSLYRSRANTPGNRALGGIGDLMDRDATREE
ncbi:hypothetical protein GCM10009127_12030 [Alteraurantiacibacter aestuarii]|uniref:DUF2927 domain-containing protein n=1 Tax=Alteraurantiacibacter aestuarii TaxID=650004 RepID=A0A844ZIH5_9SPHN|nr:hypothetical protein [Alteraurantiacibacter aestuarii]MXO87588.1 hypothetical protein [Alteraurantiacibacter aestuarii]